MTLTGIKKICMCWKNMQRKKPNQSKWELFVCRNSVKYNDNSKEKVEIPSKVIYSKW